MKRRPVGAGRGRRSLAPDRGTLRVERPACMVEELDRPWRWRENPVVLEPGASRRQIARTLNAAYANGLLSHDTFTRRLDDLLGARLIDPVGLIGDLSFRRRRRWPQRLSGIAAAVRRMSTIWHREHPDEPTVLLALDWTGRQGELLLGRHHGCDVVLSSLSVSRRHARLVFRDGSWVLQDLESTNGTTVNGVPVGRCTLRPGDKLALGDERLRID